MVGSPNQDPAARHTSGSTMIQSKGLAARGNAQSPGSSSNSAPMTNRPEEVMAARLLDSSLDLSTKLRLANELRETVESNNQRDSDYRAFVEILLPSIMGVLRNGKVSFNPTSQEHRLRHLLLETLHRFPHLEPLRAQAPALMNLLLYLLQVENEDNAALAMKIVIDVHRTYKDSLASTVDAFLTIVKEMYGNMSKVVAETFGDSDLDDGSEDGQSSVGTPAVPNTPAPLHTSGVGAQASAVTTLPMGMKSFKVLTECPIAIVFLFQSHRDVVAREIKIFVPLIFDFLTLQPAAQVKARELAQQRGETFVGVCSALNAKRVVFNELLVAQVKTISFLAYVIRVAHSALLTYRSTIPEVSIRMLKDIPPEASANRKELLVAIRHILATDFKSAFVAPLDQLLDERILIGTGTTSHESLRPLAYSMIADLVHHVRVELNASLLSKVVHAYSCNMHDATLQPAIQTMCCKLLLNLVESIVSQDRDTARSLLNRTHEAFVRKLEGLASVRDDWPGWCKARVERRCELASDVEDGDGDETDEEEVMDQVDVERARPIAAVASMSESHPDLAKATAETRIFVKTLITGSRSIINSLRHTGNSPPDGVFYGRIFRAGVRCLGMFDPRKEGPREGKEVTDIFTAIFNTMDLLVFQEIFEVNMDFFFKQMLENPELLPIAHTLSANETHSQAFLGILIRFLVARLDSLGNVEPGQAHILIKLFKMACLSVTYFAETNEAVLQPHLNHIITESLRLASRSKEPTHYYLLLRNLFRAIGGGRFELLYKEVLPLLQTLLENLNGLIDSAPPQKRDLFVELVLTVPVRLSVLLPYLNYLMRPLVYALQAGPELISQGLRTLELCLDNLTPDFLTPLMAPVIDDVMTALWKLLRPLPHNPQHAHTTVRLLGKLGGRSRKLLGPPRLEWKPVREEAFMPISFEGKPQSIVMAPLVDLAVRMFRRGDVHYRQQAYQYLKHSAILFLKQTSLAGEPQDVFVQVIRGLFDATRAGESSEEADVFLRKLISHIFTTELSRESPDLTKYSFPLSSALLDAITETVASAEAEHLERVTEQLTAIIADLLSLRDSSRAQQVSAEDEGGPSSLQSDLPTLILHQWASKISSLCYEPSWHRKTGGAIAIDIIVTKIDLGPQRLTWLLKHETDFVRALFFMLKDMPSDPPGNVDFVTDTLYHILRICNEGISTEDTSPENLDRQRKMEYLVGIIIVELSSQVGKVREVARGALTILSECAGVSLTDLLRPLRERLLSPIFTKPLRALAFGMQVGFIDAVTFSIELRPPLIEIDEPSDGSVPRENDSQPSVYAAPLNRLLTEALGIADADDNALTGRQTLHKNVGLLTQLRVVCVKLLSAALATTEYQSSRQHGTRARILQVYFKLLYARSPEVVDAVYKSLKIVLAEQGKLPKDLLQIGLRPVLMNLSDHKRLTVSSLAGLARLLELLANYFKVEIGTKLLDHLRALAGDLTALTHAALNPQKEEGGLVVMGGTINIFRLLPHPAASQFLEDLTNIAVQVESQLKKVGTTPFTRPLAGYLDRYPVEAADYFFARIVYSEACARTFCSVLNCAEAAQLRAHVIQNAERLFPPCFASPTGMEVAGANAGVPQSPWRGATSAAEAILVLLQYEPLWLANCPAVVEAMRKRWRSSPRRFRLASESQDHLDQLTEDDLTLRLFTGLLSAKDTPKHPTSVQMLFEIVDVFAHHSPTDRSEMRTFFHVNVAASDDVTWKRSILDYFFDSCYTVGKSDSSSDHIALSEESVMVALRLIINPILLVAFSRGQKEVDLVDSTFIAKIHRNLWQPVVEESSRWVPPEQLKIELLFMSTLLVRYHSRSITENRKDVIKFGWIGIKDEDPTVKNAAYSLIAHFLAAYDSPAKIVNSIFSSLLRMHQPEARSLVRESLDVLAARVPHRMGGEEEGPAVWLRWSRKVIIEDGHASISQLTHVYQLMVRHPDLYFLKRDTFVPHIVNSVPKLSLVPTATMETRMVAIDLVELLLKWERKRLEMIKEEQDKMDTDPSTEDAHRRSPKRARVDRSTSSALAGGHSLAAYTVPLAQRDAVVTHLVRLIGASTELTTKEGSSGARALSLLKQILSKEFWTEDVSAKLSFFRTSSASVDVSELNNIPYCNTCEALVTIVAHRPDEWVLANLGTLHRLCERALQCVDHKVHAIIRSLLERLFAVVCSLSAEEAAISEDVNIFIEQTTNSINEALRAPATASQALASTLIILHAWAASGPERIDSFIVTCVRCLTRMVKEHLSSQGQATDSEPGLKLMLSMLELLCPRILVLGEQRRWLLSGIVQLVEKSQNVTVCRFILDTLRRWVLDRREAFPTVKEKAVILQKMQTYETRDEGLVRDFYTLILDIYTDPAFARSELTVRLEHAFLLGCRTRDATMRCKFLAVFDESISRSLFGRLHYIIGVQSWEILAEASWVHQALDLLLGAVDRDLPILPDPPGNETKMDHDFIDSLRLYTMGGMIDAARKLLYADATATQAIWVSTFKAAWATFSKKEQSDIASFVTSLLSKEYHLRNIDRRPNNVQAILAGLRACSPLPHLPPHLIRYLGKTFNAWHTALELLQETALTYTDEDAIRETAMDAIAELYSDLSEDDLFYGLWRRRCFYTETSVALSYEQIGMWQQAQIMHEAAQTKARTGAMPFTESEYAVWEDHWVMCAQKLQQWDILSDLAKHEGNAELLLECAWRLSDWANEREQIELSIKSMSPVPTPRKRVFEAYMALIRSQTAEEKSTFSRICDDGTQLALRKWFYLPEIVSDAHVPLLQVFQQFVELAEAHNIFASLATTTAQNLDQRSQDMKNILQTWRERLPNQWDDINVWSDVVAWRQHVFSAINRTYIPLVPLVAPGAPGGQTNNSQAYRGHHETAWIINRFAHVARKHGLVDVCMTSLTKIYTLPNIEIQEAFLKLREQAKCHYQNSNELATGLEVINNTNLGYFSSPQKAEFYTLKGMFMAKLGLDDEARTVFNQAITMDMTFPKGWAEWGFYHDRLFKSNPADLSIAANAVSCYLQASGLWKNAKVRKLLVRILWLLSLDDQNATISRAFDAYKGEIPTWYWVSFIPQLLQSLSHREGRYARIILMKVAKNHPQALYFQLRTTKEDCANIKRSYQAAQQQKAAAAAAAMAAASGSGELPHVPGQAVQAHEEGAANASQVPPAGSHAAILASGSTVTGPAPGSTYGSQTSGPSAIQGVVRHPWEHVDELVSVLKTAFPLLALSMETFCDQIQQRFKQGAEEDIHRLLTALLNDALVHLVQRANNPDETGTPLSQMVGNVAKVAEHLPQGATKAGYQEDFVINPPATIQQFVQKLQKWRDRSEYTLDRKVKRQSLENNSHWLVEFPYHKFDDIEVPGQYLKDEDSNANFVRIDHFHNKFDFGKYAGTYSRRLAFVGHDGTIHPFLIQSPSPRYARREERIVQFFRMLNCPLSRRKESRKRNLHFHMPLTIPLATHVRLVQNDASVISLQEVWEQHCSENGTAREDPVIVHSQRMRELIQSNGGRLTNPGAAKLEIFQEITTKLFPDDILKKYMIRTMNTASDLWHFRKQMSSQMASFLFLSYIFYMGNRTPNRIFFSRSTGLMHTSDMLPGMMTSTPEFINNEPVPFRFTPNLQAFMTAINAEGILACGLLAIARSVTEDDHDLEYRLSIFVREEVAAWYLGHRSGQHSATNSEQHRESIRDFSLKNIDNIVKRATLLACRMEREKVPYGAVNSNQAVLDLVSSATNLNSLALMDVHALPWL